jgi:Tfp pilus assembly protein PilO
MYGCYNWVYLPLKKQKEQLADKINAKERELRKAMAMIKREDVLPEAYTAVLEKLKQNSSDEKTMSSIIYEIEGVANESSISITEMKPQRVRNEDFYNNFSVSLATDGSIIEIMKFLHTLQNETHFFTIEEARFSKVSPRSQVLKCQLIVSKALIP